MRVQSIEMWHLQEHWMGKIVSKAFENMTFIAVATAAAAVEVVVMDAHSENKAFMKMHF